MGLDVSKETSGGDGVRHGRSVANADPATQLAPSFPCFRGVLVTCDPDNTDPVYFGNKGVTVDNGFPVAPGSSMSFPVEDPNALWIISSADGQNVAWIGV